ncbi:MAG: response regulator [Saprospiraceae bacterium]
MTQKKLPIIYADDNPYDIELFLEVFNDLDLGSPVVVLRDGQEVLNHLSDREEDLSVEMPEAILLDIKMPKINGLEVLKKIRAQPVFDRVPIIMITSSEMAKDIAVCYESGANAYVVKPIDFDEFVDLIASLSRFWTYLNQFEDNGVNSTCL